MPGGFTGGSTGRLTAVAVPQLGRGVLLADLENEAPSHVEAIEWLVLPPVEFLGDKPESLSESLRENRRRRPARCERGNGNNGLPQSSGQAGFHNVTGSLAFPTSLTAPSARTALS